MNAKNINPSECTALTKEEKQYRINLLSEVSEKLKIASKLETDNFYYVWKKWFAEDMDKYKNPFHTRTLNIYFTTKGLEEILSSLKGSRRKKTRGASR